MICFFLKFAEKREWKPLPVYNIVHWKYALPRWLAYNFSCLSLKIVKSAFHWRWIFAFVANWHVAMTWWRYLNISLPIVKWLMALSLKHHTKICFFSFLANQNNQNKASLGWFLGNAITVAETRRQKSISITWKANFMIFKDKKPKL